jgi:hypothetical protein
MVIMMKKIKFRMKPEVGPHLMGNSVYEAGDIIELYETQATSIMFKLIRLEPREADKPDPEPEVKLKIVEADGGWDVVNEKTGQAINNNSVTLEQAKALAGPKAEIVETPKVDPDVIKAIHRGGGRYALVWEKSQTVVVQKLWSRAEASDIMKRIEDGSLAIEEIVEPGEDE